MYGARWVDQKLLAPNPEWNLRVYAIWVPVVAVPEEVTRFGPDVMTDRRVRHLFDLEATTSHWWYDHVLQGWERVAGKPLFHQGLIWDAFFLYGPEATSERFREDCLAAGATVIIDRPLLLEGLSELFPQVPVK